jgi:hypothetical protein
MGTLGKMKMMAADRALSARVNVVLRKVDSFSKKKGESKRESKRLKKTSTRTSTQKKSIAKKKKEKKKKTTKKKISKQKVAESKLKKSMTTTKRNKIKQIYNDPNVGGEEHRPTRSPTRTRENSQQVVISPPFANEDSGDVDGVDEEEVRLRGLTEMKEYIDRIDRRLFDRYGTPPRSKKFDGDEGIH